MGFSSQKETNSEQTLVSKNRHMLDNIWREKQDWFGKNPYASMQSKPDQISMKKKISVDVNRDRQQGDPNFKKLNKKKQYIQKKVSR